MGSRLTVPGFHLHKISPFQKAKYSHKHEQPWQMPGLFVVVFSFGKKASPLLFQPSTKKDTGLKNRCLFAEEGWDYSPISSLTSLKHFTMKSMSSLVWLAQT